MKITAYILAADPAWLEASVLSYYDIVAEIVVAYDKNGCGFTGRPMPIEECLRRLRAIDRDGKFRYCPGVYAQPNRASGESETRQRQQALDEASQQADWVLQLDTDEVLGDARPFLACLHAAHQGGFGGLDYPARWLYQALGNGMYLEACSRFWGIAASYPGPIAVKAGTRLSRARECRQPLFRVDFRPLNTDPWHAKDKAVPVHRVINDTQGIFHLSMVRSDAELRGKFDAWQDPQGQDWQPELQRWAWCGRHPYLAAALSPVLKRRHRNQLRVVSIEIPGFASRP